MTDKLQAAGALGSTEGLGAPVEKRALVVRLRERGDDLRCHPVANGTIACTEEAGELLIEAASALEAVRTLLNAAAGEGFVLDGVDAADLYMVLFPERDVAAPGGIEVA